MHPSKILELQKNFGGTPKQGSPKNQHFTAGLLAFIPHLRGEEGQARKGRARRNTEEKEGRQIKGTGVVL